MSLSAPLKDYQPVAFCSLNGYKIFKCWHCTVICGERMLNDVRWYPKCYYIMRSDICYVIDWGFHIIAMGLIATRGWARATRVQNLQSYIMYSLCSLVFSMIVTQIGLVCVHPRGTMIDAIYIQIKWLFNKHGTCRSLGYWLLFPYLIKYIYTTFFHFSWCPPACFSN